MCQLAQAGLRQQLVQRYGLALFSAHSVQVGPQSTELLGGDKAVFIRVAGLVVGDFAFGLSHDGADHLPAGFAGGQRFGPAKAGGVGIHHKRLGQIPTVPLVHLALACAGTNVYQRLRRGKLPEKLHRARFAPGQAGAGGYVKCCVHRAPFHDVQHRTPANCSSLHVVRIL